MIRSEACNPGHSELFGSRSAFTELQDFGMEISHTAFSTLLMLRDNVWIDVSIRLSHTVAINTQVRTVHTERNVQI
jgi:hypothetical protein